MDQLKPAIEWCKKNIFWIACFLLSATLAGIFFFSSTQLAAAQKKRTKAITDQIRALESITKYDAEPDDDGKTHPNKSTEEGMDAEMDRTISAIAAAWQQRYDEQKEIFNWPVDVLGQETCDFFSSIEVVEKISDPGKGFEKFRKSYYDNIPKFVTKICRELGTNWKYDPKLIEEKEKERTRGQDGMGGGPGMGGMGGPGMGGMGPGMGQGVDPMDELNKFPVVWDEFNQDLWYQKLTDFAGYDDHTDAALYPTFLQANMLQQDLWLLEAMFKNIKKLNGDSSSNDTSKIKTIDHVVFGREALVQLGVLSPADPRLSGKAPKADPAAGGGQFGPGGMSMGPGGIPGGMGNGPGAAGSMLPGGFDPNSEKNPYHGRYVGPDLTPIKASEVKAVIGGEVLPENNLELIVAKRVPFRLAVEMDEREIHNFIAICANSNFVFEVNQLRVNRHFVTNEEIKFNGGITKNDTAGMGGPGMGMGGMGGPGMGMGGMGGPGMGMGGMGGPGMGGGNIDLDKLDSRDIESRTNFDVAVEFYGVVKIYNPVRENFLRKAAGQEVVDETATEMPADAVAAPAATTPKTTTPDATTTTPPAADPAAAPATTPEGGTTPTPDASATPAGSAGPATAPAATPSSAPESAPAANPNTGAAGQPAPGQQPATGQPGANQLGAEGSGN
jgi:hypothetical protein